MSARANAPSPEGYLVAESLPPEVPRCQTFRYLPAAAAPHQLASMRPVSSPALFSATYGQARDALRRPVFSAGAISLTCEFSTFSPTRVLTGLQRHNRATRNGAPPRKLAASRRSLRRLFDPPSPSSRAAVLPGGEAVLRRAFDLAGAKA